MSDKNKTHPASYQFDGVTVDLKNIHVRNNGHNVVLTPRAFDVLRFLLENRGRLVEKHELFEGVWKGTFVSDNALTKIIKEIRHALEDSASEPHYIETLPKRGYRFIAPVIEVPAEGESSHEQDGELSGTRAQWRFQWKSTVLAGALIAIAVGGWYLYRPTQVPTPAATRSVAVLPFKPLNSDTRDESFELGMAEALITRLGNLRQLTVRPLSAVRKYTGLNQDPVQAGREVQAQSVLDGSVQTAGDRIRVTVRLIDVETGTPFWSEQFDENISDVFKVQDSIAERIATAFAIELSRSEKELITKRYTNDPKAYELYLQAQLLFHGRRPTDWLEQSLDYFQRAVDRDPNFALAYIGIQRCYFSLATNRKMTVPGEVQGKARAAIMKAVEIDDSLGEAHNALAEMKYQIEYDWPGAEVEFKKAIALNPNVAFIRLAYGWFLMSQGRVDEAEAHMELARTLDPSSLSFGVVRAKYLYYTRRYDLALEQYQNVVAFVPNDLVANLFLFYIYEQKQMYPEAVESLLRYMSLGGHHPPEVIEELRQVNRASGREAFFKRLLEILEAQSKTQNVEAYRFAIVHSRLRQKDETFAWLEKMFDARDPLIIQFKIDPANDWLRDDPRYEHLVRRIGLNP